MKLLNIFVDGHLHIAVLRDKQVLDLTVESARRGIAFPGCMEALIGAWDDMQGVVEDLISQSSTKLLDEADVHFGPVVSKPQKVICVGLNYRRHAREANLPIPSEPLLFGKFANAVAGHKKTIDISHMEQVDYEAELAIIIGKSAKNISTDVAMSHVFGYANANDLSEREWQFRSGQWMLGKSFDHALPIGPYLVTRDDIPDPNALTIKGWMNNELRQDSSTSDMIFSVGEIVSYASRYMTLEPGDVISTGTPEGVILGHEQKVWMRPGDNYTVEIEGLGRLSNILSA